MPFRKFGLYCGIISPILWLALIATAGALRPDFSHVTDYISELGERGSATEALMNYGAFGFTGFLYLCFAAALLATFRDGWLRSAAVLLIAVDGVGRMGAGAFPCDPGCVQVSPGPNLHRLFATIGFSSGILAAFVWGFLVRRIPPLRPLSSFSVACGAIALVSLLLMSWARDPALPRGLFEHVATVVLSIWLLVFAVRLLWTKNAAAGDSGVVRVRQAGGWMRRTQLLCVIGVSLWAAVVAGNQAAPAEALSEALRAHVKDEQFGIVTSIRGLPLGVRDGLQTLFGTQALDIAEPGAEFQVTDVILNPKLPIRRLVAAGCSIDHCLVYYERGGIVHTWQVALFHWTPAATRFEWGGTAPSGLKTIDDVRNAILSGAIKSPASW